MKIIESVKIPWGKFVKFHKSCTNRSGGSIGRKMREKFVGPIKSSETRGSYEKIVTPNFVEGNFERIMCRALKKLIPPKAESIFH